MVFTLIYTIVNLQFRDLKKANYECLINFLFFYLTEKQNFLICLDIFRVEKILFLCQNNKYRILVSRSKKKIFDLEKVGALL